jgi:uncharacterized protein (DUF2249 family)
MTKDDKELNLQRVKVLMDHDPQMTHARAETLIYRWSRGRTGPSMRRVDRVLRKAKLT